MGSSPKGATLQYMHRLFGEGALAELPDAQLLELYICHRDELAFKALVQRHGPMVQAVCRGVVGDANDADDAFQATFLLLVRKSRSLWVRDSLGGWLHRVACRIAIQAKSDLVRRRDQERRAAEIACAQTRPVIPWDDANIILHQEIDRLPERFRQPIVLCYLEGMTYQQAARHLGWSAGSTQGRLTRARQLLRARLTRRGVTLSGAVLGTLSLSKAASAVSIETLHQTLQSARYFALAKGASVEMGSTAATALVKGVLRNMMIAKLKMIAAATFLGTVVTGVATGLSATSHKMPDRPTAESRETLVNFGPPQAAPSPPAAAFAPGTGGKSAGRGKIVPPPRSAEAMIEDEIPARSGKTKNLAGDLLPRGRLDRGDSVFSTLCGFKLQMRRDGNLVLYGIDDVGVPAHLQEIMSHSTEAAGFYNSEIWSSGTNVPGASAGIGSFCVMHANGNLVVYDENSRPCFETDTRGYPGAFLRCQNDGNMVIYTPRLEAVWQSGTYARPHDEMAEPIELPSP